MRSDRRLISDAVIADRLRCMLIQIRDGHTTQVLLHATMLANLLRLEYPNAPWVRDLVYEALTLYYRGNAFLAGQRLRSAIECLTPAAPTLPLSIQPVGTRAARA